MTGRVYFGSDEIALELTWDEAPNPPIDPPQQRGFGHIVVTRTVLTRGSLPTSTTR